MEFANHPKERTMTANADWAAFASKTDPRAAYHAWNKADQDATRQAESIFSGAELEYVKSVIAPRAAEIVAAEGIEIEAALIRALLEARSTYDRVQGDRELRESILRGVWVTARTASDVARVSS